MYVGESSFDENGNQIGFVMKNPGTYGFDIKKECISGAKTPIKDDVSFLHNYLDTIQKYIEPFRNYMRNLILLLFFGILVCSKSYTAYGLTYTFRCIGKFEKKVV